jgi:hypothetical protein
MNSNGKTRFSENPSTLGEPDALQTQTDRKKSESKFESDILNGLHTNIRTVLEVNKFSNVSQECGGGLFIKRQDTKREQKALLECGQDNIEDQKAKKYK